MKTFKRNKKQTRKLNKRSKSSRTSSRTSSRKSRSNSRARGWFKKTLTTKEWFEEEGDKLNKIMVNKLTTMEHNKMCLVNRKKYVFTTCEKPIAKIDSEIDQLIQKVIDRIKLEQRNTPNFDYVLHLNIFSEQFTVQNKSNVDFS